MTCDCCQGKKLSYCTTLGDVQVSDAIELKKERWIMHVRTVGSRQILERSCFIACMPSTAIVEGMEDKARAQGLSLTFDSSSLTVYVQTAIMRSQNNSNCM